MTTIERIKEAVKDLPSYILDDDLAVYAEYAPKVKTIVDVGTGWGKSALALSTANEDAEVFTFDTGQQPIASGSYKNVKEYNQAMNILFGNNAIYFNHIVIPTMIDLLHLDLMPFDDIHGLLEWWLPRTTKYLLYRNFEREEEKKALNPFLNRLKLIETKGRIAVYENTHAS